MSKLKLEVDKLEQAVHMKDLRVMDLENQMKHDKEKLEQALAEVQKLKEEILGYKEKVMKLDHELTKMEDYQDVSLREIDRNAGEMQR